MKSALIIILAIVIGGVIASKRLETKQDTNTESIYLNEYRTPSGRTCTSDEYLKRREPGEEECKFAGFRSETIAIDPELKAARELEHTCAVFLGNLQYKKFADMTPNDIRRVNECAAGGH
jgi:hypothetical protein